jgi:hypothetical protein
MDGIDQRREPRFKFEGATILVFDDAEERRTVAVTQYYNVSRRGACVLPPATGGLAVGSRLTMLPQPYLERREVVVVNRQAGSLHLELPDSQEFSEFEVAEMIRAMPREELGWSKRASLPGLTRQSHAERSQMPGPGQVRPGHDDYISPSESATRSPPRPGTPSPYGSA